MRAVTCQAFHRGYDRSALTSSRQIGEQTVRRGGDRSMNSVCRSVTERDLANGPLAEVLFDFDLNHRDVGFAVIFDRWP